MRQKKADYCVVLTLPTGEQRYLMRGATRGRALALARTMKNREHQGGGLGGIVVVKREGY